MIISVIKTFLNTFTIIQTTGPIASLIQYHKVTNGAKVGSRIRSTGAAISGRQIEIDNLIPADLCVEINIFLDFSRSIYFFSRQPLPVGPRISAYIDEV